MGRVTMSKNRMTSDVNLTEVARQLEGYTGSDITEVCREAVVCISHEAAKSLEDRGMENQATLSLEDTQEAFALRPVRRADFQRALKKLSASVSKRGREVSRVLEWNDQYGEVKTKKQP